MNTLPLTKLTTAKHAAQLLARLPVTLAFGLAALAIAFAPSLGNMLQFHRASVAAGAFWRLATCHLTHWNWEHLRWDLFMFVLLGAACELRNPWQMRGCVALAATVVTGFVLYGFPHVDDYRGLSGIDTALFTMLAMELVREARREGNGPLALWAGGFLAGFVVKTAYEATTGQTMFVDHDAAGFVPLVWDHIAAGAAGAVIALSADVQEQRTNRLESTSLFPPAPFNPSSQQG